MRNYDLNTIFPHIDRFSLAHDEGKYYDILRLSPSVTIISGGQSGVDSAGLKAASFLGLPAFAIMPIGGRREGESLETYAKCEHINLRKIELATKSYRFRTYANSYYGDVTLIFDFVGGSEGTICTLLACQFLKRPYLLLTEIKQLDIDSVVDFLLIHKPAVINIAGNSKSKISRQAEDAVCAFLIKALRKYAYKKVSQPNFALPCCGSYNEITIAIPNFGVSKELFKDFFQCAYGVNLRYGKRLVLREDSFTLVLARPREIIRLLKNGVDVGFVGEDLCSEYNYTDSILLRTGLIPNATVLVAKQDTVIQIDKICSQYPVYAKKLLDCEVAPITGSAEAYLGMGIFDASVDSYQTGDTVAQNNLCVVKKLSESTLVMLGDARLKESAFYNKFVKYMNGEL